MTTNPEPRPQEPQGVSEASGPAASSSLSPKDWTALTAAWKVVYRLLRYRPRTEAEIRRALARRGFAPELVEAVVAEAREIGWLDDEAFARLWVEQRARNRPRAAWVLARELREKGLPEELVDRAVARVDDRELLRAAAEKALRRYGRLPLAERRRKVMAYLARRGFAYELIREWLEDALPGGMFDDSQTEERTS